MATRSVGRARGQSDVTALSSIADARAVVPLAAARAALNGAGWSDDAFRRWRPALDAQAGQLTRGERPAWTHGLRRVLERGSAEHLPALLRLGVEWDDWPLVRASGERLRVLGPLSLWHGAALARAYLHTGHAHAARALHHRLPGGGPDATLLERERAIVDRWLARRAALPFPEAELVLDDTLRLEPLGAHHRREVAWQYLSAEQARRQGLWVLKSDEWRAWIDACDEADGPLALAVLHQRRGLVGVVNLLRSRGAAAISFWIGAEHRDRGLGTRAGRAVLALARRRLGLRTCYASAYRHNAASLKVLEKLGFRELEPAAGERDPDVRFHALGNASASELLELWDQRGDAGAACPAGAAAAGMRIGGGPGGLRRVPAAPRPPGPGDRSPAAPPGRAPAPGRHAG